MASAGISGRNRGGSSFLGARARESLDGAPERRTSGAFSRDSAKARRKRLPSLTEAGRRSEGMMRPR